jgi:hypothetical protein
VGSCDARERDSSASQTPHEQDNDQFYAGANRPLAPDEHLVEHSAKEQDRHDYAEGDGRRGAAHALCTLVL